MAVLFATNANGMGIGGIQANLGEPPAMQIAPILFASAEQTEQSAHVGGKKKIKSSDKLSLSLSMMLSIPGNVSTQPGNPAKSSDAPQEESVAKERRLSELYAQIAETEKTIQVQQRQMAILDKPSKSPSNTPPNISVAGTGVVGPGVIAQGVVVGNMHNIDKEQINPQMAARDVQPLIKGVISQIESFEMSWMQLAIGLAVSLLTALAFFWNRNGKVAHKGKRIKLQVVSDMHEGADSAQPSSLVKTSVPAVDRSMKIPAYTEQKIQAVLPPEYEMLEEADIYLRFGHDKLAEEALREAIKINPKNPQANLTLSRLYSSRKDSVAFLVLAKQLKLLGDESVWNKVAEMGRNLDPNNTLYG
jgi:hypothetical protein